MFDGTYAMDSSFNLGGDFFTSYSDEDNIHGPGFELSAYKLSWPQRSHQVQNCTLHFRWLKDGVLRKTVPVFVTAPGRCVETWLGYEHVVKVVVPHQTMLGYGRRLFGFTVCEDISSLGYHLIFVLADNQLCRPARHPTFTGRTTELILKWEILLWK